ncbi:MAG: hypothetical protein HWE21_13900 [Cytophagia bacterium]|nr:hypothetical protein [Cytophagia bacterium]
MHLKLTSVVVLWWIALMHPFHISVMDAEYNNQSKSLQISHRLFLDDLEEGLKDFHGLDYIDTVEPENPEKLDSLINSYLQKKVFFVVNGEDKEFEFYGSELEGDARWCYYEIKSVETLKELEITNVALMDVFDDQQNIMHIKAKGKIQSYKLDKGTKVKTFTF